MEAGGETAAPSDVWRTADEPYLKRVSDRIPGTDRYYCDIGPRFKWTVDLDESELENVVSRYLATFAPGAGGAHRLEARVLQHNGRAMGASRPSATSCFSTYGVHAFERTYSLSVTNTWNQS